MDHLARPPKLPDAAVGLIAVLGGEEDASPHLRPDGGEKSVGPGRVGVEELRHVPRAEE